MAYKFQRGDATYSGSLTIDEDLAVTEAITGTTSITAGTSFIIGSADLNEADMEKLDGITNGTAAASKAVVLDASKNIATIGTVGCGAITSTGASSFGSISSVGAVTSTGVLSSSAQISGSSFWGDGSGLTGISSDNVDVANTTSDLNYQLVAVTASGDGVNLVTMNTAASRVTINGSSGKMILDGPGIQIGAADITEAEFEFLDGATAGSVVNSKAVVYSAAGKVQGTTFLGPDDVTIGGATVNDMITIASDEVTFKDGNYKVNVASHDGASYGLELAGTLVTSTAAELNYVDVTAGTAAASKAMVLDADKGITGVSTLTASYFSGDGSGLSNVGTPQGSNTQVQFNQNGSFAGDSGLVYDGSGSLDLVDFAAGSIGLKLGGVLVSATAAELNLVDGITAGTVSLSKAVIADADKSVTGFQNLTASYLSITSDADVAALTSESTLSASTGISGASLTLEKAAINAAGAVSGVTTLAASGLLSVASISMDDGSTLGPDSVAGLWTFSADGDTTQADGAYDFDLASHDGTNGLKLGGVLVSATAAELNYVDIATLGTAAASKALTIKGDSTWTVAGMTCADIGTVTTIDLNGGTIDGATIGVSSAAVVTASYLAVNGNVDLGNGSDVVNVNARLDFGEGASANMQHITSNDTLAERDFYNIVSGSGAITVTLPGNSGLTDGTIFYIKRGYGMTNNVTIAVADSGAEMLDGDSSIVLDSALAAVQLFWDSTAATWHVF